jgi:type II secretory pathway component PulJ
MTLLELLVAGIISIIAASGMIIVMANTLGTNTQTIHMTRVSQEMRTAMQIMTRELRRANYHSTYRSCYGNVDCRNTLGITSRVGNINITNNGTSDCFYFWYDRPQTGTAVPVTSETVAAFWRTTETVNGNTVGKLQMTTTQTAAPGCNANDDWVDITNPEVINILTFDVSNAASITETINGSLDTQTVEKIAITMTASLSTPANVAVPAWIQNSTNASRTLTELVKVRNPITTKYVAP